MRWSDERFWNVSSRHVKHAIAAASQHGSQAQSSQAHLLLYEDYVARCSSMYGLKYLPVNTPGPEVMGTRDGIFTHIRAFGPKPHQWEMARRYDPTAVAVWQAVKACGGPCKVVWK